MLFLEKIALELLLEGPHGSALNAHDRVLLFHVLTNQILAGQPGGLLFSKRQLTKTTGVHYTTLSLSLTRLIDTRWLHAYTQTSTRKDSPAYQLAVTIPHAALPDIVLLMSKLVLVEAKAAETGKLVPDVKTGVTEILQRIRSRPLYLGLTSDDISNMQDLAYVSALSM